MFRHSAKKDTIKDLRTFPVSSYPKKIGCKNNLKLKNFQKKKSITSLFGANQHERTRHHRVKENKLSREDSGKDFEFSLSPIYRTFDVFDTRTLSKGTKRRPKQNVLPYLVRTRLKFYQYSIDENSNEDSSEELLRRSLLST